AEREPQLLALPRLGHVAVDAAFVDRLGDGVDVGVAGQDDAHGVGADRHRALEDLGAAHRRHALVGDDHRRLVRLEPRAPLRAASTPWLMASPSPVPPPTSLVVKNGSKMRPTTSGAMPTPSSRMVTRTRSPSARVVSHRFPRPGIASHALASTFMNTWFTCPGSHSTGGSVP